MIARFIISGAAATVLIRGMEPSLVMLQKPNLPSAK
jgi:hypothetical protein